MPTQSKRERSLIYYGAMENAWEPETVDKITVDNEAMEGLPSPSRLGVVTIDQHGKNGDYEVWSGRTGISYVTEVN